MMVNLLFHDFTLFYTGDAETRKLHGTDLSFKYANGDAYQGLVYIYVFLCVNVFVFICVCLRVCVCMCVCVCEIGRASCRERV